MVPAGVAFAIDQTFPPLYELMKKARYDVYVVFSLFFPPLFISMPRRKFQPHIGTFFMRHEDLGIDKNRKAMESVKCDLSALQVRQVCI